MKTYFVKLACLIFAMVILGCKDNTTVDRAATPKKNHITFAYEEVTVQELLDGYKSEAFTVTDVIKAYLNRIEEIDQNGIRLNSIIQINPDALSIAEQLDNDLKNKKPLGPLHGIPVVLKDNIDTYDKMFTTAGSRALAQSKPLQDSEVAKQLRVAGAVILGKANLSEWANFRGKMSSSGWSGVGGQTKNSYVLDRNPCGSSSGSGVAVSANLTVLAIGTETNGSIVCPSNNNGIVGIKPTVGLVSRSGIIPISFTQDTAGPMARTVMDAALCLNAIVGIDSTDSKTLAAADHIKKDYTNFLKKDGLKGKRIGIYTAPLGRNYKVDTVFNRAITYLESQGATTVEIDNITDVNVNKMSFEIMLQEYRDGLNHYFKRLGDDAPIKNIEELIEFNKKDSVEMAFYGQEYLVMAAEKEGMESDTYKNTLKKMQTAIRENGIDKVMDEHNLDALVSPTGGPAWKTDRVNGDSFGLGSSSPAAISGYPNITVPMGFVADLPVGISFFGRAWSEPVLLEIAYAYEQGTKHRKAPSFLKTDSE